jgi:uncharacterized protein with von Willebrand factor type A (vWA) domain
MTFKTIEELLGSPLSERINTLDATGFTERVLKSTRLENHIYKELHDDHETLGKLETEGLKKLNSFKKLAHDAFQSCYAINPRFNAEEHLTASAKKINRFMLNHIMNDAAYPAVKAICEGKELPAIEAAAEFMAKLLPQLDALLKAATGEKERANVLDKLELQHEEMLAQLANLLNKQRENPDDTDLRQKVVKLANRAESKSGQIADLGAMIDRKLQANGETVKQIVATAFKTAAEKAEAVQNILLSWGDGAGEMRKTPINTALLNKVKASPRLMDIAKYLGRYKEMLSQTRKNGFAYGRGEKYDVEYGNHISKALTSELSLLAAPELIPLFLRKHQNKQLKQYRRREAIIKGGGDIIVCLDESGSTFGDPIAWGRAVAFTLLDICQANKRGFALIHFANTAVSDIFPPEDKHTTEHFLSAAETFLNGGTNFEAPIKAAVDIIENQHFENADVVFITDGICQVSEDFKQWLTEKQTALKFTITGILLDVGANLDFSLKAFADKVYRTSELCVDEITRELIKNKI